jgi:DNA-binding transcriptional LysR family regulator
MIKQFVRAGLGISFMAASNCQSEVASGSLATVSLAPEPMIRHLGLIYRKDKSLSKASLGFIQATIEHAAAQDPQLTASVPQIVNA